MKESKFAHNDNVIDPISGFTGVVTGICFYLTGNTRILVSSRDLKSDGSVNEFWFDEDRLILQPME